MRMLLLGPEQEKAIATMVANAEKNIFEEKDLKGLLTGDTVIPGDDPRFHCYIPQGYKVVYTLERHTEAGLIRHLSISVDAPGMLPSIPATSTLMKLVGFTSDLESGEGAIHFDMEEYQPGYKAISIYEQIPVAAEK